MPALRTLVIGDAPEAWEQLGFTVGRDHVWLGRVAIQLAGTDTGRGILGWTIEGVEDDIDGLRSVHEPEIGQQNFLAHDNGMFGIDRLEIVTDDLDRTSAAFESAGLRERTREVEPHENGSRSRAVFWAGRTVIEVVESTTGTGEAAFGGLSVVCDDFDRTVEILGSALTPRRAASQADRYRASIVADATNVSIPIDVISPPPNAGIELLAADTRSGPANQ